MSSAVILRAALPSDAYALAELSIMAGDGMYEFLLEEMAPREMLAGLMARSMKQDRRGNLLAPLLGRRGAGLWWE